MNQIEKIRLTLNKKPFLLLPMLLLLTIVLSACGAQAQDVALSEQVPPRRGGTDVLAEVQEISAQILGVPEASVVEDANFQQDLDADEEEMNRLVEALSESFSIEFTDVEIESVTTVQSLVDLIESKKQ